MAKQPVENTSMFYGLPTLSRKEQEFLGIERNSNNALSGVSVYDIINDKILAEIEKGNLSWRTGRIGGGFYKNFVSKKPYTGICNLVMLEADGKDSEWFMTAKQIQDKGGKIRKGAKAIDIFFKARGYFKTIKGEDENGNTIKEKIWTPTPPFLMYYTVFAQVDIEGIDIPLPKALEKDTREVIKSCKDLVDNMPNAPKIENKGHQPSYSPSEDMVRMPNSAVYEDLRRYYSTLFHELAHSTGHPKRLNRDMSGNFGSQRYAFEELVAELTACYLCGYAAEIISRTYKLSRGRIIRLSQRDGKS